VAQSTIWQALGKRYYALEKRLHAACRRTGRQREDVTLVAVTKTITAEVASQLPILGFVHLGENRPQELWRKAAAVTAPVSWHFIGHLQRNKIERTVPLVCLIHAVDSLRLLAALEQYAAREQRQVDVLLEVNASREASKHGFLPEDVPDLVPHLEKLRHVHVLGLMTMAAYEEDPERCRPTFAKVRELRDRLASKVGPPHQMRQLSMGMSNDFEVAIEEGATLVRIGTALFEGLSEGTA